jgi:hypothetical protein
MTSLDKLLYSYSVDKLIHDRNVVILEDTDKLDVFVNGVIEKKKNEEHHMIDSFNEAKRWRTGVGGELALEKFINKAFVDLSIGDSKKYHTPDLHKLGISVGIKTVEYGKYPLIFKSSNKPEIIVVKLNINKFAILGLATVDILNRYQDDNKILSPSLRSRGTKSGFVGLHMLKPFNSFDGLQKLL